MSALISLALAILVNLELSSMYTPVALSSAVVTVLVPTVNLPPLIFTFPSPE